MTWLYLALLAYLINAVVFIIDKYLLSSSIPKYHAYAFGAAILSIPAVLLIPFGVTWYGIIYFLIAFSSGAAFFFGLMFLYKSIKDSDVSVAATQVGTLGAIFTYIFSIFILKEQLYFADSLAFVFLILGIFLLGKIEKHAMISSLSAGVLFGLSFVLLKFSFNDSNFINGLFWTRLGFIGGAILSLLSSQVRQEVISSYRSAPKQSKLLFIFNKILAGTGFVILYLAILQGKVSLVNALLGLQFLFTFLLVLFLRNRIPGIREKIDKKTLASKFIGIGFVLIGFLILFLEK